MRCDSASPPPTSTPVTPSRRWRAETYVRTVDRNPWIPHPPHPRQRLFLLLADVPEVLYGGAAGGGKSDAALMAAVQFVHVPGYAALLLRKAWPDLMQPNALIPRAKDWWLGRPGVEWSAANKRFTFACPGGGQSTITFGYVERDDDVYQYQGAEYQFIGIDELTQHREWVYRYLFSRLRKPAAGPLAGVPLRMRGFTNPGGRGHEFVKRRFIDPQTRDPAAVFVAARLADNPSLDAEQYAGTLNYLDPITRAQLLAGDWDAVEGGRFRREWFGSYRRDPQQPDFLLTADGERFLLSSRPKFQTCDPSASESSAADFFVLSTFCLTPKAKLLWLACERRRMEIPEQVETCQASYRRWNPQWVAVEEVLNQRALAQLLRRSTTPAMVVRSVSPLGRDKLARATSAINLAHSGRVLLPEDNPAFPLDDVIGELTRFTGDPDQDAHDDIVDTLSYAAELLPGMEGSAGGGSSGPSAVKPSGPAASAPLPGIRGGGLRGFAR